MTDHFLCLLSAILGYAVALGIGAHDASGRHSQIKPVDPFHWQVQWHLCNRCKRTILIGATLLSVEFYLICQLSIDNYRLYVSNGGHMPDTVYIYLATFVLALFVTVVASIMDHNMNSPHALTCVHSGRNWYKCKENPLVLLIFFVIIRFLFWFGTP